jgi:hypothetical protein
MPAKKASPKTPATSVSSHTLGTSNKAVEMADSLATQLLDKNKDGQYKDDVLRMAWDFIRNKFFKPKI